MTTHDDHRHLARVTILAIVGLVGVFAILLSVSGRANAVAGLLAGGGVAVADVLMLSRGLSRFARIDSGVSGHALTGMLLVRCVSVGVLLGLVMMVRVLNPVAAVVGFLTMPMALTVVGGRMARQGRRLAGAG